MFHFFSDFDQKDIIPIYVTKTGSRVIQSGVTKRYLQLSVLRIPGNVYKQEFDMLCKCTCRGSVANDDVSFTRLFTPSIVSEPSLGDAFATNFRFRVLNVRTGFNNALLAYRFGYHPDGGGDLSPIQWLSGWSASSELDGIRLPLSADIISANVKIIAQIRSEDEILDQVSAIVPLTRPTTNGVGAVNTADLLQTLSKLTKEFLIYDLFKGTSLLNARIALHANLNHLVTKKRKKRKRRALPESDLQYDVIQLIDVTMASPFQPETIDQALRTINELVVKSSGRLHSDMVTKIKDFLMYVTTHADFIDLGGDISYGSQVNY